MLRGLIFCAALVPIASAAMAQGTDWRCTSIEVCDGLSCVSDTASFAIFEQTDPPSARVVLHDASFAVPFAGADAGVLDDAPYAERRYVEREGEARPTIVLTLRNPSGNSLGVSLYWPGADVATSREIIGRCVSP